MPSAIDATKPADGVAAVKGDLRAALAAAKSELEHCGFFIPAGTGAIERTGTDKAREVVSVRDFGASPSASASTNATAFQAAIDATIASGGGRIIIPRASEAYDIDAALEIFYRHNNGTTTAPSDGDGVRKLASVWLDGEGGADHDSVFIQDRGSVLNFTGTGSVGLFDLSSDWGARFSRLALVNSGTGSPAQLVRLRSFDGPVTSAVGTVYEECYFIDDADNITDALVTFRERKMVTFRQCVWPTGTDALRIGENAGVNSTLMNGSVSGVLLHQ